MLPSSQITPSAPSASSSHPNPNNQQHTHDVNHAPLPNEHSSSTHPSSSSSSSSVESEFESASSQIQYVDRATGILVSESPPGESLLRFLYGSNPFGTLTLEALVKRKIFSTLGGWYLDTAASRAKIEPFVKDNHIQMDDYECPIDPKHSHHDAYGYRSFNEFFYRKIKMEKRPVGKGLVSPADGKLLVFENFDLDTQKFFVKGEKFSLKSFLGITDTDDDTIPLPNDPDHPHPLLLLLEKFAHGSMVILRLAPTDYHRFAFPVSGTPGEPRHVDGNYYSVSPLALRKSIEIFCQNKRQVTTIHTQNVGELIYVEVGATMVGTIVQTFTPYQQVQKGQEKGYFAFGGSTVVLILEKGRVRFHQDLVQNTSKGLETAVKLGESIADFIASDQHSIR